MTIRSLSIFLAALALAPQLRAQTGDAPQAARQRAPLKTSAADAARAQKLIAEAALAYRRLRSYSGRFRLVGSEGEVQSGEIHFARPNKLSMRIETRNKTGSHTRRALSDGRFLWISDSRVRGNFIKTPLPSGRDILGELIAAPNDESNMVLAGLMSGMDPLEGVGFLRITSPPSTRTLEMQVRWNIASMGRGETELKTTQSEPSTMTLGFGPDKLLRLFATQQPAPEGERSTEKHFGVRLNPVLPASTWKWKPARGARQVQSLD